MEADGIPCLFFPFQVVQPLQNTFRNCSAPHFGAEWNLLNFFLCLEREQCEQEAYPQQKMFQNGMYLQSVNMV